MVSPAVGWTAKIHHHVLGLQVGVEHASVVERVHTAYNIMEEQEHVCFLAEVARQSDDGCVFFWPISSWNTSHKLEA